MVKLLTNYMQFCICRQNFAKLNVYFNDLNYDDVVEEAEYPVSLAYIS